MALEPITFYFHYGIHFSRLVLKSSEAQIWYSFQAADQSPSTKPLFVFFNGGPGSATSSGLMSMYTSRYTLDNRIETGGGDYFIINPVPWTSLGNLLYIDARQAGFSYNLMDHVEDMEFRFLEFNSQNFNPFLDAADFIRVLLRFLAAHPEIQNNRVVIVGESYGGIRSTAMLHMLLNYIDYGDGTEMYQDEALVDEIQAHFDVVFPDYEGQVVPPEAIIRQFGHQVLIQPALTMQYQQDETTDLLLQPGSVIDQLSRETGIPYDPDLHGGPLDYVRNIAARDLYIYTKPRDWLNGFFGNAGRLLQFVQNLALILGADVTAVAPMYATARTRAYRIFDTDYDTGSSSALSREGISCLDDVLFLEPARLEAPSVREPPGDLSAVFGILRPWDRYFIGTNYHANWAAVFLNAAKARGFEAEYSVPRYGRMFLKNLAYIDTFITNAALDLVVFSNAIPPALARHSDIVASVQHVTQPRDGEVRPGQIIIQYQPSAFPDIPDLTNRTVRFPLYDSSCHAVSLTQPLDFYEDAAAWLLEHGIGGRREFGGINETNSQQKKVVKPGRPRLRD
jgi:hypothetical protein